MAPGDLGRLVRRHTAESLAVLPILDRLGVESLIDLGAGGGFPGIPLKLARPDLDVALVESRRLKALFLRRVVIRLGLEGAWVWVMRAEGLARLPATPASDTMDLVAASAGGGDAPTILPRVDLVTARAVAPLAVLADWSAPLIRRGGHLLAFKGSRLERELEDWRSDPTGWELKDRSSVGAGIQVILLGRT